MKAFIVVLFTLTLFTGCQQSQTKKDEWKKEIMDTEEAFSEMAGERGISEAFLGFAAKDVVINRNDSLIFGIKGLQQYYQPKPVNNKNEKLSWKPDFVDVSNSGDLGYTFGKYVYSVSDSMGNTRSVTGVFHTVWKRQADGTWRFVWD